MGTKGEMFLDFEGDEIRIFHFEGRWWETIHTNGRVDGTLVGGHGGGDPGIVNALYDYMTGAKTADEVSEIGISCENTRLVFAAERSRLNGDYETNPSFVRCGLTAACDAPELCSGAGRRKQP